MKDIFEVEIILQFENLVQTNMCYMIQNTGLSKIHMHVGLLSDASPAIHI